MQSLDIISVNFWQIVISLCNLLILFLIIKKFLFKPVKKAVEQRENAIKSIYDDAYDANAKAQADKKEWEEKMLRADEEAEDIMKNMTKKAEKRSEEIVDEAKEKAENIITNAKAQAELEHDKVADEIKKEIVTLSTDLTEKMLSREISADDHRALIDSFFEEIG